MGYARVIVLLLDRSFGSNLFCYRFQSPFILAFSLENDHDAIALSHQRAIRLIICPENSII
jgi:hypothetical protein